MESLIEQSSAEPNEWIRPLETSALMEVSKPCLDLIMEFDADGFDDFVCGCCIKM